MKFLYPYKNALWALRPAKPSGVLSRHPCRNPKPLPHGEGLCMLGWLCIMQSLLAYTPGIRAGAILLGLPPLNQARMHAVSHTKPLHDAVAQMADDLYGGYAPATPFLSTIEVFRQTDIPAQTARGCFSFYIEKSRLIIISRLLKKLSSPTSPVVTISL